MNIAAPLEMCLLAGLASYAVSRVVRVPRRGGVAGALRIWAWALSGGVVGILCYAVGGLIAEWAYDAALRPRLDADFVSAIAAAGEGRPHHPLPRPWWITCVDFLLTGPHLAPLALLGVSHLVGLPGLLVPALLRGAAAKPGLLGAWLVVAAAVGAAVLGSAASGWLLEWIGVGWRGPGPGIVFLGGYFCWGVAAGAVWGCRGLAGRVQKTRA